MNMRNALLYCFNIFKRCLHNELVQFTMKMLEDFSLKPLMVISIKRQQNSFNSLKYYIITLNLFNGWFLYDSTHKHKTFIRLYEWKYWESCGSLSNFCKWIRIINCINIWICSFSSSWSTIVAGCYTLCSIICCLLL